MITAETVNGIVRFPANGLPVVSLYCRVDPGASQREVSAACLPVVQAVSTDGNLTSPVRVNRRGPRPPQN
jgi:hypothetical protein